MTVKEKVEDERDLRDYVVTTTAITLRTGPGRNDVRRFRRKAKLRLDADSPATQTLVQSKCIAELAEGAKIKAATAMAVTRALGADDDPAAPPIQSVLPVTPSKNDVINLSE